MAAIRLTIVSKLRRPWTRQTGLVARAYVSKIDDSVQRAFRDRLQRRSGPEAGAAGIMARNMPEEGMAPVRIYGLGAGRKHTRETKEEIEGGLTRSLPRAVTPGRSRFDSRRGPLSVPAPKGSTAPPG